MERKRSERLELTGSELVQALDACRARIKAWNLVMPRGEPLALDFGLGRFYEVGEIEFQVANSRELGYCGKFLFLFEDQTCPLHHHLLKHETFFVLKGEIEMNRDGESVSMKQGAILAMPVKTRHSFTARNGPALVLEVSKPCMVGDSIFADTTIGVF